MSNKLKRFLKEEYNKLKKAFDKLLKPQKENVYPQPAMQPYRNKKRF